MGADHAAFPATNEMGGVKLNNPIAPKDPPPCHSALPHAPRSNLDDRQLVAPRNFHDGLHLAWLAHGMNHLDRFCFGNRFLDQRRIDVERIEFHIHKRGVSAAARTQLAVATNASAV